MVAITEGVGSGSKLFQSLLDSHPEICMIPGYALYYFYPFWYNVLTPKNICDWENIFDELIKYFPSIINTKIDPGSESLNKLGPLQNKSIVISLDLLKKYFLLLTDKEEVNARNCIVALHCAYDLAKGKDIKKQKIIVYHIHAFFYVSKYLFKDFPDLKVIAAVRDQRSNIRRRVTNSIIRPNERRLRKSDAFLIKQRSYRQVVRCVTEGLDSLYPVDVSRIRVFKHEDLATRLHSVMLKTASFLQINNDQCMFKATWGGQEWHTTYYNFDSKLHLVNPGVLSDEWKKIQSKRDIYFIEGMCFDHLMKYYKNTLYYSGDSLFNIFKFYLIAIIPTKIELKHIYELFRFDRYLTIVFDEIKNLPNLQSYKTDLFYKFKWTNESNDYPKKRIYEFFINDKNYANKKNNLIFASILYFLNRLCSYCWALCFIPINLLLRIKLTLSSALRRIFGTRYIPEVL